MDPEQQPDRELDFSHYMEKPHGKTTAVVPKTVMPETGSFHFRWRPVILLSIAIILAGVLWYMLYNANSEAEVIAPPGYRIIESPNQPPKLEKFN